MAWRFITEACTCSVSQAPSPVTLSSGSPAGNCANKFGITAASLTWLELMHGPHLQRWALMPTCRPAQLAPPLSAMLLTHPLTLSLELERIGVTPAFAANSGKP